MTRSVLTVGALLIAGCGGSGTAPSSAPPPSPASPSAAVAPVAATVPPSTARIDRDEFNRVAFAIGAPIFWQRDVDGDGRPGDAEVGATLFATEPTPANDAERAKVIQRVLEQVRCGGAFCKQPNAAALGEREQKLLDEIAQMRPTLVRSDFRDLGAKEKEAVRHVLAATRALDRLHARQKGMLPYESKLASLDPVSRAMFARNWGPRCAAPRTENDVACTAIPGLTQMPVDVYPTALQQKDPKFCAAIEKHPDAKRLFDPFTIVREQNGKLVALPMNKATTDLGDGKTSSWSEDLEAVAKSLEAAAQALDGTNEKAFAAYLVAAAKAFRDGTSWFAADEAWSKMSARNSRFYLRIGPDETYWEPCSRKAGFHVSFARVSAASLAWQDRLEPVKQSLEESIAVAIGAPYAKRSVTFHLPEFIEVAWNGGDSRDAIGATIGQSLPNWGPVPAGGRGRTVAMANLYTDEDSLATKERSARTLFCNDVMPFYPRDREAGLVATILHEATHNLGPSQEYKYKGKTDDQWLGGGLASTMEELKAQTGALFFLDLLRTKGTIDEKLMRASAVDSIAWAFGHVSRGMTTPSGERKPYSQLAAVQVGMLEDEGALSFKDNEPAANGKDRGCFSVDWSKLAPASSKMMTAVGKIKATGDKAAAEALTKKYVDAARHHAIIRERMLREPRQSFVYAVDL